MRKDIEIPRLEGVYVAAIKEKHPEYKTMDWNAYLINDREFPLEMVLIVTKGAGKNQLTSTMRHSIKVLPAKSYAKIEFLQEEVLQLENTFAVTFFAEGKMFEKRFVFSKNSVKEAALETVPVIPFKGVLAT